MRINVHAETEVRARRLESGLMALYELNRIDNDFDGYQTAQIDRARLRFIAGICHDQIFDQKQLLLQPCEEPSAYQQCCADLYATQQLSTARPGHAIVCLCTPTLSIRGQYTGLDARTTQLLQECQVKQGQPTGHDITSSIHLGNRSGIL